MGDYTDAYVTYVLEKYETAKKLSPDAETVRYKSGTRGVDVELEVDGDGVVVHYPALARRV